MRDETPPEGLSEDGMRRAFEEFWRLFIVPEIERRKSADPALQEATLFAAQIIFHADGRPTIVRLNHEVAAELVVAVSSGAPVQPGIPISFDAVERISDIRLPQSEDPDCAHVTMVRHRDMWHFRFDFHYNKGLARRHLAVAREFLSCAAGARRRKHWAAFLDNLFSAAELTARAELLHVPDPSFRDKASHKSIQSRYNLWAKMGNTVPQHRTALNRLAALREKYRYLRELKPLATDEAGDLLRAVKRMIDDAESQVLSK